MQKVLVVEDDNELAKMVDEFLSSQGYVVSLESNGIRAVERVSTQPFDAVVLDIGLPGKDGLDVCRAIRPGFRGPIIVLTARGEEIDEVVALEVGADDFMSKPVRPHALLARLKVHLRKAELSIDQPTDSRIVVDELVVVLSNRTVTIADREVELSTAEFDLLKYLAERAGSVVDRRAIYTDLQGIPYDGVDRSIDLRVSRLRRKLGDDPTHPEIIKSIRGVGYLMAKRS